MASSFDSGPYIDVQTWTSGTSNSFPVSIALHSPPVSISESHLCLHTKERNGPRRIIIRDIICSMMTHQEKLTVWSNAYTAALAGLLSKRINDRDRYTANNVNAITDQCKAFADRAVSDVAVHGDKEE